jgi:hypothetical protein
VGVVGGVVKLLGETSHREMKGGGGTKREGKAEEKEDGKHKVRRREEEEIISFSFGGKEITQEKEKKKKKRKRKKPNNNNNKNTHLAHTVPTTRLITKHWAVHLFFTSLTNPSRITITLAGRLLTNSMTRTSILAQTVCRPRAIVTVPTRTTQASAIDALCNEEEKNRKKKEQEKERRTKKKKFDDCFKSKVLFQTKENIIE